MDPLDQLNADLESGSVFGTPSTGSTGGSAASQWDDLFQDAAKQYGISPRTLKALVMQESSFNPQAVGKPVKVNGQMVTAKGLAQLMPGTASDLGVTDPFDPKQAIPAAARLLRQNLDYFEGDFGKALSAYNGGKNPAKWTQDAKDYPGLVYKRYTDAGGNPAEFAPMVADNIPKLVRSSSPGIVKVSDTSGDLFGDIIDGIAPPKTQDQGGGDTAPTNPLKGEIETLTAPNPPKKVPPPPTGEGEAGPIKWGGLQNTLSGMALGFGPEASAAGGVVKQAIGDIMAGKPAGNAIMDAAHAYEPTLQTYRNAMADYQNKDPVGALVGNVAGSTATTLPILGAAGAGARLAGGKLATELPEVGRALAPVGRFLMGEAGTGGGGGLMARGGNALLRGASRATAGAETAAGAGLVNQKQNAGSVLDTLETSGALGAGLSLASPLLGKLAGMKAPVDINAEVARLAARLDRLGVKLPISSLAKGGAPSGALANIEQHTAGVARTIGADSPALTPDVLERAKGNTSAIFENVAKHTSIDANDLIGAPGKTGPLAAIEQDAMRKLPTNGTALPYVRQQVTNILNEVGAAGQINGDVYQSLTRYNGSIGKMIKSPDADIQHYGVLLRNALDDALEANSPPGMIADLQKARAQWKNMLIAEPATDATTGLVNPKQYAANVAKFNKDYGYTPGTETGDLARAAPFLGTPTAQGSVKAPGMHLSPQKIAGLGALGVAGGWAGEHIVPHLLGLISENPLTSAAIGIPGALALGGRKVVNMLENSPAYRNLLLRRAGAASIPMTAGEAAMRGIGASRKAIIPAASILMNR